MTKPNRWITFVAGVAAGVVLSLAVAARAGWNEPPSFGPDRTLLEKLARSSEDSVRRLGDIADAAKESARRGGESASAQAEIARTLADMARRCK